MSDNEELRQRASKKLRQDDPKLLWKLLLFPFVGGTTGVLIGSLIKDVLLQVNSLNLQVFLILIGCAGFGGALGGLLSSQYYLRRLAHEMDNLKSK
jgi:hypothetical protein